MSADPRYDLIGLSSMVEWKSFLYQDFGRPERPERPDLDEEGGEEESDMGEMAKRVKIVTL